MGFTHLSLLHDVRVNVRMVILLNSIFILGIDIIGVQIITFIKSYSLQLLLIHLYQVLDAIYVSMFETYSHNK